MIEAWRIYEWNGGGEFRATPEFNCRRNSPEGALRWLLMRRWDNLYAGFYLDQANDAEHYIGDYLVAGENKAYVITVSGKPGAWQFERR